MRANIIYIIYNRETYRRGGTSANQQYPMTAPPEIIAHKAVTAGGPLLHRQQEPRATSPSYKNAWPTAAQGCKRLMRPSAVAYPVRKRART